MRHPYLGLLVNFCGVILIRNSYVTTILADVASAAVVVVCEVAILNNTLSITRQSMTRISP